MLRSFLLLVALVVTTDLAAQDTTLRAGRALRATLEAGDTIRYRLNTESEFFVTGAVEQISVDVVVRIINPDGGTVLTIDGPARGPEPGGLPRSPPGEMLPAEGCAARSSCG